MFDTLGLLCRVVKLVAGTVRFQKESEPFTGTCCRLKKPDSEKTKYESVNYLLLWLPGQENREKARTALSSSEE